MLAKLDRARSLERDVVHAAAMLVLYDRALREARADMDDGILAVVEPDAAELEIGTVTRLQAKHVAVELLDRRNILRRAPDVEMQKTLEFHGRPPGQLPSPLPKFYHKTSATKHTENTNKQIDRIKRDVQESRKPCRHLMSAAALERTLVSLK